MNRSVSHTFTHATTIFIALLNVTNASQLVLAHWAANTANKPPSQIVEYFAIGKMRSKEKVYCGQEIVLFNMYIYKMGTCEGHESKKRMINDNGG